MVFVGNMRCNARCNSLKSTLQYTVMLCVFLDTEGGIKVQRMCTGEKRGKNATQSYPLCESNQVSQPHGKQAFNPQG